MAYRKQNAPIDRRGNGKFKFDNGDMYVGGWLAIYPDIFVRDGKGLYVCEDGSMYYGYWRFDQLIDGRILWPDGPAYVGNLEEGQYDGRGTFSYSNGTQIDGTYSNNRPVGNLKLKIPDGSLFTTNAPENEDIVKFRPLNMHLGQMTEEEMYPVVEETVWDEPDEPDLWFNKSSAKKRKAQQSRDTGKLSKRKSMKNRKSLKRKSMKN